MHSPRTCIEMKMVCATACTSVITEIQYNDQDTIKADIEYLTTAEWRDELEHLLKDSKDTRDGRMKRRSDMTEEAAVAWEKVNLLSLGFHEMLRLARYTLSTQLSTRTYCPICPAQSNSCCRTQVRSI